MKKCPLCEADVDVKEGQEDALKEGETIECPECGENLMLQGQELVEADGEEEDLDEDEDGDLEEDEDEEEEEED